MNPKPSVVDSDQTGAGQRTEDVSATPYDAVPYPNYVHPQTHPDRLAALTVLFGMSPAPVDRCRVLELGCGQGANLIPIAAAYPDSHCVGIDLSSIHIQQGNEVVQGVGLSNITLNAQSITDFPADAGEFDYIVCHGVYSWVPEEVREKILAICDQHLSGRGVAIISYNTFPGWHQRRMIRDMMGFHTKDFTEPAKRVEQARAFLAFMNKAIPADSAYGKSLQEEAQMLSRADDSYLFHEQLEEINEPQYFHQFAADLEKHNLQYLNEVELGNLQFDRYPPQVAEILAGMKVHDREQYLDFLMRRTFRQTLVCKSDVPLDRNNLAENAKQLWFACPAATDPKAGPIDLSPGKPVSFAGLRGVRITVGDSLCKSALVQLGKAWPDRVKFADLEAAARKAFSGDSIVLQNKDAVQRDSAILAEYLLRSLIAGAVSGHASPASFTTKVAEKPTACRLARYQAQHDDQITSRHHQRIALDPLTKFLLSQLDGEKNREQLIDALVKLVIESELVMQHEGKPVESTEAIRALIQQNIEPNLKTMARQGFLIG